MHDYNKTIVDPSVEELYDQGELTIKAFLVCKNADMFYLSEIIENYNIRFQYTLIRNCGSITNEVLMAAYNKYKYYQFIRGEGRLQNSVLLELNNLTNGKMYKLRSQIEIWLSCLSARSLTVLMRAGEQKKPYGVLEIILDKKFVFSHLRNAGPPTVKELEELRLNGIRLLITLKSSLEE